MPYQEDFAVEQFMDKYETDIDFNLGETCCYSLSLNEIQQLSNGEPYKFNYDQRLTYGAIKGTSKLREQIASLYGEGFTSANVLITNGAIGANFLTYYTLVGKDDHTICITPTYNQLFSVPEMFGSEVSLLHLEPEDKFLPNLDKLKSMIKSNTKLIIINNPNNPLGVVIPNDMLEEIAKICKEKDIYLHSDEVYRPIFHSLPEAVAEPKSCCEIYDKAVCTGSMSKGFALAGIRLGWIVSKDLRFLRDAASRRDYNTISVSMIDDSIASYALDNVDKIIERNYKLCLKNLDILNKFIAENNDLFEYVVEPQGGTVCLVTLKKIKNSEKFAHFLAQEYKVLSVPGECLNYPGTLRIGLGNGENDLVGGLPQLKKAYLEFLEKRMD